LLELDVTQQYYISTVAVPVDEPARVLKYGDLFAVFNRFGDIDPAGSAEEGLYYEGTRFLSEFVLYLGNSRPLLLSSTISKDNFLFIADCTNIDMITEGEVQIPRGNLHLHRSKFLRDGVCYEKFRLANYGLSSLTVWPRLIIKADFADIFEVRGTTRQKRGTRLPDLISDDSITLAYEGLDRKVRRTEVWCNPAPARITATELLFRARLAPKEEQTFYVYVACKEVDTASLDWGTAFAKGKSEIKVAPSNHLEISSSNDQFNRWVSRSVADVETMIQGNPEVNYPYAGIPWFSTVFGRDGIITALECLWLAPAIAKGVLTYLAKMQATSEDMTGDAEPGKILHEMRKGEMARLGEVPFGLYYGSVDATPLFVMLAAAFYRRTADIAFIQSLWPNIEAALSWIDNFGDRDGDGFVEYARQSANGLVQQGWKDSHDSIFHANGELASPPIALCEVQGYVYAAKRGAAELARLLGHEERAMELTRQADSLRSKFEASFWCPEIGSYAIALDGKKQQCRVRASNAGHCLFTGIAHPDHAQKVAEQLLGPELFSGWGVRTIGSGEARYNPISYHNGSVWPHDNAIIAAGLSRYGLKHLASRMMTSLMDASVFVELQRLPELFCGLHRRDGEGPTLYPVACSPQAWAAASVFMMLEACLGIFVDAPNMRITSSSPQLPESVGELWIKGVEVGHLTVDLFFERRMGSVEVSAPGKPDGLRVVVDV
jgi:glycogen debranching enzyme